MATAKIRIDDAAVNRMLNGRGGPVSRDLERRGRNVGKLARQYAPGSMKRKISVNLESGHVRVECSHPATLYVVRKTQPHAIRPNPPRKRLRFKGRQGIVFTKFVWHPGNRHPNNFLAKALRAAAR
jgi:hypothetical protein